MTDDLTYKDFLSAVRTGIQIRLGCTEEQARNLTGDINEMYDDALMVDEAVTEIVAAENL